MVAHGELKWQHSAKAPRVGRPCLCAFWTTRPCKPDPVWHVIHNVRGCLTVVRATSHVGSTSRQACVNVELYWGPAVLMYYESVISSGEETISSVFWYIWALGHYIHAIPTQCFTVFRVHLCFSLVYLYHMYDWYNAFSFIRWQTEPWQYFTVDVFYSACFIVRVM